ncbi:response regulator [Desulfovibrio sp.]|uniref:response regulator n=1 Tax=Desulfovibrio sp. TaxID=885 RepID=UPI0035B4CF1B
MALRILLADDEKEFVDTLAERLSLRGFAPYVVYDGISALQAATPEKPDVVVLDLFMPGLPGDEVLRRLKVLYPDLPVILLTGHEAVDDNGTNPVSQAFACLTKPLSFNVFLETLQAAAREGKECAENGAGHE